MPSKTSLRSFQVFSGQAAGLSSGKHFQSGLAMLGEFLSKLSDQVQKGTMGAEQLH